MKNIKWGNKELPGVSHEELCKLNHKALSSIENLKNVDRDKLVKSLKESGKLEKWRMSGASKGGKVSGKQSVESGQLQSIASAGGKATAKIAEENGYGFYGITAEEKTINAKKGATATAEKKRLIALEKGMQFVDLLPSNNITQKEIEDASVAIGYSKRQASRLAERHLLIDNHVVWEKGTQSAGKTNWKLTTYKKK